MTISKKMKIGEVLEHEKAELIAAVLMKAGMHCLGCPASQMETIEEACQVHGIDCEKLISQINEVLK